MKKTALALLLILLLLLVSMFEFCNTSTANPVDSNLIIPNIQISYPLPFPLSKYENSTVKLEIYVNMFIDAPKLSSISYSLDGKPLVHLENLSVNNLYDFGSDKIDFTVYTASTVLEDLSEGNHTVTAYARGMSVTRTFTVNSHYQVTVVKVLSPTNQSYSKTVPLVFTVNGKIEEAHYYMYKGYESVFEKSISGNTTLDNLSDGNYSLYLYVTTEYGEASAATYFSILSNTQTVAIPNSPTYSPSATTSIEPEPFPTTLVLATSVILAVIGIVSLVYFKKHKQKLPH